MSNNEAIESLLGVPPQGTPSITEAELASLRATKNEREWNAAVVLIEKARDGHSPPDWWAKVQQSGLHHDVVTGWA